MTVYIIRHGESLANLHSDLPRRPGYEGIHDQDVPLSVWGFRQAKAAGEFLRGELGEEAGHRRRIVVIHSPFLRTRQTMEGVLAGLGRDDALVRESHLLREQSFGLFSGITDRRIIEEEWPEEYAAFRKARKENIHYAKAPDGEGPYGKAESRADVVQRAKWLISEHQAIFDDPNTDVVLIGHGLVNRAVEMCLRGLDKEWLRDEPNPSNCAVRKLEGELRHGYTAEYVHRGEARSQHLPKDSHTAPHGRRMASALAM